MTRSVPTLRLFSILVAGTVTAAFAADPRVVTYDCGGGLKLIATYAADSASVSVDVGGTAVTLPADPADRSCYRTERYALCSKGEDTATWAIRRIPPIDCRVVPAAGAGPAGPPPFVGTRWNLETLGGVNVEKGDDARQPRLVFLSGGDEYWASDGCNRLKGSVKRDGEKISFGTPDATEIACKDAPHQEAVAAMLSKARGVRTRDDVLELFDGKNASLATFRAGGPAIP